MNLIDKDKLDELVGEPFEKFLSRLNLSCPPTVDAIPIKWVDMWLLKKVFIWEATTMAYEKDRLQAIENIKYGFETMLKDWEKENANKIL